MEQYHTYFYVDMRELMMWGAISFAGTKDFEVNTPPTAGPLARSDCPAGFHYPSARERGKCWPGFPGHLICRMEELCSVMSTLVAEIFNTESDDEEFKGFQESDFANSYGRFKHMSKLVAEIFNTESDDEEFMGFQESDFANSYGRFKHISKTLADIFDAPSDEEFSGFPEDECNTLLDHAQDKPDKNINVSKFQSKYITEELIEVFTDDSFSVDCVFEGFPSSTFESNGELDSKSMSLEMEDEDEGFTECEEEEEEDDDLSSIGSEMEPTSKKPHFGLCVAFKFPTRRPAKRKERELDVSESESDDDSGSRKKRSNVLLKRAMNIKENKEMLAKLMAELKSMPGLFPVNVQTSPSKPKRTPKRTFSEGKIERRMNPTRNARPPEGFSVEKLAMDQVKNFRLRSDLSDRFVEDESLKKRRRRSFKYKPGFAVNITEEDLENIAITVKDKIYDRCMGNTCHQCRQKTIDTKTICRNHDCYGVRGQFCGPCLRNRYGENVKTALLNPDWVCPPCRGICNCSFCRRRDGRCATGILVHLAKFYGYDNVQAYLESLQKQLIED
ncbi:cell division cycle-associated 7-like protein isoform X2 [Amblyraja radiata]|uniref:cell division cycle-associated 7-like protein isoform X2 n=1 Tax=Amblyraja radiata TaxID=386614 RepID=UPI001402DE86|nr:cell division cycle-associated 7-like protein isoform X2 [Amblyraja radiata]